MKNHLRACSATAAALAGLGLAAATSAAVAATDATYTSEAVFTAAAGPGATVESFETLAARNPVVGALVAPALTVTPDVAPLGVQTGADTPVAGNGASATDGTHYLYVYLAGLPQGTLHFTLPAATTAFGLNITDVGEAAGVVTLRTNAGAYAVDTTLLSFPPQFGSGGVFFVGLTQATPFTDVYLGVTGVDEAYGIDKVIIGAVPEPAAALTLLAGLGLMAARRARRAGRG